MSLITHTYNVTTEENITELEEEITYDVTELRMDPDYIRSGRSNAPCHQNPRESSCGRLNAPGFGNEIQRMDEMNQMDTGYIMSVKAEQWQIKKHDLTDFLHHSPTI